MKKATIIFGSTTGNTEIEADKIAETMTQTARPHDRERGYGSYYRRITEL